MKRKDLKPGEWYAPRDNVVCLALPRIDGNQFVHYVDAGFDGKPYGYDSHIMVDDSEVTPCDPPAWFSEVWVRKGGSDE